MSEGGGSCDDGDACNGFEFCLDTQECATTGPLPCDDGDACNGLETCAADQCVAGETLVCADSGACGAEICDPSSGCVTIASVCDDEDPCTNDSCVPETGCTNVLDCLLDGCGTVPACM